MIVTYFNKRNKGFFVKKLINRKYPKYTTEKQKKQQ